MDSYATVQQPVYTIPENSTTTSYASVWAQQGERLLQSISAEGGIWSD